MITIRLEATEVKQKLKLLQQKTGDLTPAMRDIATLLESQARRTFATETDPSGAPWLPSQRKLLHGGKTLTKSGRLASSIRGAYGPDWAAAGTNVIYGKTHQFGWQKMNIPRRAFLPSSYEEINWEAIKEIINHYLE